MIAAFKEILNLINGLVEETASERGPKKQSGWIRRA